MSAGNGAGDSELLSGRRVLIIVENLPVPFDRRVWLEALTLRDAGAQVTVICPKMKNFTQTYECLDGIHIYRHPLPYEASSSALGFLLEYTTALLFELGLSCWVFARRGFDVIHACNPPDTIFLVGRVFKLLGRRFLFDQHDINPELYIAKYGRKDVFYRLLLRLERWTYRTADVVISTNESYRAVAMERGGKRAEDVFVVRSAPDTTRFHAVEPVSALKNGRQHLVAYLGVMGKQEGVELLLESVVRIVKGAGRQDISFVLVGGGPELKNMMALSKQLGIDEFVTFTGRVPDEELLQVLSTADLCVNPDRVNEMNDKSTMNKIMEYMAVGKPIVQFDMVEGRYSAQDASLYARPNDTEDFAAKILELIDDEPRRRAMGAAGLKRLQEKLDWKYSQVALRQAYARVFEPKKKATR